jgi:phosphoglycerol transferase MdoB-like AlkP superfamily enzyme
LYLSYWLFWLGYFVVTKLVFLIFNWNKTIEIESLSELLSIFYQGSKLDLSVTGYLILIPTLIIILNSFFKKNFTQKTILTYTSILLFVMSFLIILDASLYGHWGNRLDVYGAFYLNNAGEAMNFIPIKTLIINTLSFLTLALGSCFFYIKRINPLADIHLKNWFSAPLTFLMLGAVSIIPIRGGTGLNPINLSNVYFSNNTFTNHSAINVIWNIAYTFSEKEKLYQTFNYINSKNVKPYFQSLYPSESTAPSILKNQRPNILFIILESFTSKLINEKWNGIEITPNLNRLTKEGIYFSNFYASGDRTDEGLVSILSGYPAQPISYIINYQNKTAKLPSIIQDLKKINYHTSFYYGGDINFANMKSYLLQSGMEKIIDKDDFPSEQFNAKWGVHDHFVFDKLLVDIQHSEEPFFKTILSLSSHPPFDTPIPTVIAGGDDNSLFANAANYTDQALGDFITKLSREPKWDNTLLVLVADHSIPYLDNCHVSAPQKFKIPMIWLGGALQDSTFEVIKFSSQTDIANTLLGQLDHNLEPYEYGKNIFSSSSKSFAFYTFNHGYGLLADSTQVIYDYSGDRFLKQEGNTFPDSIGNAYLQKISNDFSSK